MADGILLSADAEKRVQAALMTALRSDEEIKRVFGTPPRVYDDESRAPAFPFARIDRHETRPAGAADVPGLEHTLTFSVSSRFGGHAYAKEAVGVLRSAIERADIVSEGQNIVLAYPTYGDVFRTSDQQTYRGILRVQIVSEEID